MIDDELLGGGIGVAGVDSLARHHERYAVRLKFGNELRQVAERSRKTVELECHDGINFAPARGKEALNRANTGDGRPRSRSVLRSPPAGLG